MSKQRDHLEEMMHIVSDTIAGLLDPTSDPDYRRVDALVQLAGTIISAEKASIERQRLALALEQANAITVISPPKKPNGDGRFLDDSPRQ